MHIKTTLAALAHCILLCCEERLIASEQVPGLRVLLCYEKCQIIDLIWRKTCSGHATEWVIAIVLPVQLERLSQQGQCLQSVGPDTNVGLPSGNSVLT